MLVVEPDPAIRKLVAAALLERGHRVRVATRGEEALYQVREHPFDLVLSALEMPGLSGLELIDALRRAPDRPEVVLMASFGTGQQARDALVAGAGDFLIKPLELDTLHEVVDRVLEHRKLVQDNLRLQEMVVLYGISERLDAGLDLERTMRITAEGILGLTGGRGGRVTLSYDDDPPVSTVAGDFPADADVAALGGFELPMTVGETRVGTLAALPWPGAPPLNEGHRKALTMLAGRAASAIENARLYHQLGLIFRETVEGFAAALEAKDRYTKGHSDRVRVYARLLAERMELPAAEVRRIEHAAGLHDIGKLSVHPDALNKHAPLTAAEMDGLLDHPVRGARIIGRVTLLRDLVPFVEHHHERWDGQGYPAGLAGEAIPLGARILAVVDAYDAMTTHRPYRRALLHADALAELERGKGSQFDPAVVDAFLLALESFREACKKAGQWTPP